MSASASISRSRQAASILGNSGVGNSLQQGVKSDVDVGVEFEQLLHERAISEETFGGNIPDGLNAFLHGFDQGNSEEIDGLLTGL